MKTGGLHVCMMRVDSFRNKEHSDRPLSALRLGEIWGKLSLPQQRWDAQIVIKVRKITWHLYSTICRTNKFFHPIYLVFISGQKCIWMVSSSDRNLDSWSWCVCLWKRDKWKINSPMSAEVTAFSARAGLLSRCQYLPWVLKDGHRVPATISLHLPPNPTPEDSLSSLKKTKTKQNSLFCLVLRAIWYSIIYDQMFFDEWRRLNLFVVQTYGGDSMLDKDSEHALSCVRGEKTCSW